MFRKYSAPFGKQEHRSRSLSSPKFFRRKGGTPKFQKFLESPGEGVEHLPPNGRRHNSAATMPRKKQLFSSNSIDDVVMDPVVVDSGIQSEEQSQVQLLVNDIKCDFTIGSDEEEDDRLSFCSGFSDESVFTDPHSPDLIVTEGSGHQLSPVSTKHLKSRSGSLGLVEVPHDKIRNIPNSERHVRKNFEENNGVYNKSLSNDYDADNDTLYCHISTGEIYQSPRVIINSSGSDSDIDLNFDDNNNEPNYSAELLTWYSRVPQIGKSASLPRKLPPPPASPRTRQRLPTSPSANQVLKQKVSPLFRDSGRTTNLPGLHTVKKSAPYNNSLKRRTYKQTLSVEDQPRSGQHSPNKSATLPHSHRLTPQKNSKPLQYSQSDISASSQPSSPQNNARRCVSFHQSSYYHNLGGHRSKQKSHGSSNSGNSKKHTEWKPIDEMTNYEGYYPDESSDSEVASDTTSGQQKQHNKSFDSVVFHVLKVLPEDFASQLTILDLAAFREIQPQELTRCGWIKKDKMETSPNVVQMTQRFNNTTFYVIHEILHAQTLKIRAEILTHFIKIAKKLHDLNNLHSLMAIISSLNSVSIHRLSKTWSLVNKHHRTVFDRLRGLVSEENNRMNLRKHIEGIKLPCIPYLGLYLGDLIFVDSAHPDTGGLESHERSNKMNNILRILAEFQQSNYDLPVIPHIKNFLQSVKYIEELQKFVEEENYKLSLKVEPNQSMTPMKSLNASREELSPSYDNDVPRRSLTPTTNQLFRPGHRKSHSLGRDIRPRTDPARIHKRRSFVRLKTREYSACNGEPPSPRLPIHRVQSSPDQSGSLPRNAAPQAAHQAVVMTTSLLDDSIISPGAPTPVLSNSGSIGSSRSNSGSEFSDDTSWNGIRKWFRRFEIRDRELRTAGFNKKRSSTFPMRSRGQVKVIESKSNPGFFKFSEEEDNTPSSEENVSLLQTSLQEMEESVTGACANESRMDLGRCIFEGCLKRKTVLKRGRKPTMTSWTKFWVRLFRSQLLFYAAKGMKSSEKSQFKQGPCKMMMIQEWMVLCSDDPLKLDSFQLSNPNRGDSYRFQSDSKDVALVWVKRLQEAIKGNSPPEKDLINLHDT